MVIRKPGDCWAINFLLTEKKVFAPKLLTLREPNACYSLLRGAEQAWRTRGPGWRGRCMAALYGVLGSAEAEAAYTPFGERESLRQAEAIIRENFTRPISIEKLAAVCGVSSVAFRRRFVRVYGMTPPATYATFGWSGRRRCFCPENVPLPRLPCAAASATRATSPGNIKSCGA